ncbi:MAG: hypothetical protein ABA06_04490 [Parcubacteria bacterium C7867-001]|nr:MAG: hypothetical protein ABA06_04490 [Parcubacteria bacterium C7867-001]
MEVPINYLSVFGATLAAIVLGTLWYGPLFGKQWMKLVGIEKPAVLTKAIKRKMMMSYLGMAITTFIMAYVFAHSLVFAQSYLGIGGFPSALQGAFWSWLGFIAPVTLGVVIWEGKPWKLWLIQGGYYLVSLILMGAILTAWV